LLISVLRRLLNVIDDENLYRASFGLKFQPELFLKCRED